MYCVCSGAGLEDCDIAAGEDLNCAGDGDCCICGPGDDTCSRWKSDAQSAPFGAGPKAGCFPLWLKDWKVACGGSAKGKGPG